MESIMGAKSLESIEYAERRLKARRAQIYAWVRQGLLPAVRIGRLIRFDPDQLDEFIRRGGKALLGKTKKESDRKERPAGFGGDA